MSLQIIQMVVCVLLALSSVFVSNMARKQARKLLKCQMSSSVNTADARARVKRAICTIMILNKETNAIVTYRNLSFHLCHGIARNVKICVA